MRSPGWLIQRERHSNKRKPPLLAGGMARVDLGQKIELLAAQCLDRRIGSMERLTAETAAWEQQRNAARARIKWMFTTGKARAKMARAYPQPQANSGHIQRVKTSVQRY